MIKGHIKWGDMAGHNNGVRSVLYQIDECLESVFESREGLGKL